MIRTTASLALVWPASKGRSAFSTFASEQRWVLQPYVPHPPGELRAPAAVINHTSSQDCSGLMIHHSSASSRREEEEGEKGEGEWSARAHTSAKLTAPLLRCLTWPVELDSATTWRGAAWPIHQQAWHDPVSPSWHRRCLRKSPCPSGCLRLFFPVDSGWHIYCYVTLFLASEIFYYQGEK